MDITETLKSSDNKGLWGDIAFYIAISLMISAVLCYFIFAGKIMAQKNKAEEIKLATAQIGTEEQKQREEQVFKYQKKINDFSLFLKNHKSSSNAFLLLEQQTLPDVWFSRFTMAEKENSVALSGEAESMQTLARQISAFEKNNFVEKIEILNSTVADSGKITFSMSLVLNQKIFVPLEPLPLGPVNSSIVGATTP